jgi:hypothetical protein
VFGRKRAERSGREEAQWLVSCVVLALDLGESVSLKFITLLIYNIVASVVLIVVPDVLTQFNIFFHTI